MSTTATEQVVQSSSPVSRRSPVSPQELQVWSVRLAERAVAGVEGADLEAPTPCQGWSLRTLLEHMTALNRGFAASAAAPGNPGADQWAERPLEAEPASEFRASCAEVLRRFAEPRGDVWIGPYGFAVPRDLARSMHTLDCAVHAWDVAISVGGSLLVEDAPASALLASAEDMPLDLARGGDTPDFGPARRASNGPPFDRVLALSGRDPGWRAP